MYVAITRARKRLQLSLAQTRMLHGQTRYNLRSRFLDELPQESLKWISAKATGFAEALGASRGYAERGFAARESRAADRGFSSVLNTVAARSEPPQSATGWRVGQGVFHNKFGEGRILAIEGQGDDARAQVQFNRHGTKWLALAIARLTPI